MKAPDQFYLQILEQRNLYKDKKSLEAPTGLIKPKYKLLCRHLQTLDQYLFAVLTSKKYTESCFCIYKKHWDNIKDGELEEDASYINLNSFYSDTKKELLSKIKERVLFLAATLPNEVFIEMLTHVNSIKEKKRKRLSSGRLEVLDLLPLVIDDALQTLGLN